MQPAPSAQEQLLAQLDEACKDLARAARSTSKYTRADIDNLLVQRWAAMDHVIIEIDGVEYTYSDSIRAPSHQGLRQFVWRTFLKHCAPREQPEQRISIDELLARIYAQLDSSEQYTVRDHVAELLLFWERLCLLADNVELDGKSDLVAVNTVLGDISSRCIQPLTTRYQPSGRLGLIEAVLKVMYHYAASQPYHTRDSPQARQDRGQTKFRSLVAALCTPAQILLPDGQFIETNADFAGLDLGVDGVDFSAMREYN